MRYLSLADFLTPRLWFGVLMLVLLWLAMAGCVSDAAYIEADAATEAVIGPKFEKYTRQAEADPNRESGLTEQGESDIDTLETWRLRIRKAQGESQPAKPVNEHQRERLGTPAPSPTQPASYEEQVMAKAKPKTKPKKADPVAEQFNVAIEAMPHVFKQAHDYADIHTNNNAVEGKQCHEKADADQKACAEALAEARDFCAGSEGPTLRTRLESMESKLKPVFDGIQHVGARRSVWKLWHTIHGPKF